MSDNKDKAKKDKTLQKKSRVKSQYNAPDDDSEREVSTEDVRVKKNTDIPDQFKQYIDEMHEYYQQQQAYLQEQNAKCFQQLFQIVCQGQQKQTITPPLPGGYLHPYCVPQDPQPNGPSFPRYYPPTGYNNNNPPPRQPPPPQVYEPPPPNKDVLYDDVVNGTRVTVSESPPHATLPSTSHHSHRDRPTRPAFNANEERQNSSSSLGRESLPQVNLFITVAPQAPPTTEYPSSSLQQPPSCPAPLSSHIAVDRHKEESSVKYDLEDLGGEREDVYVMPRRRSVRDALRERMKDRDRHRSRNWIDRERE